MASKGKKKSDSKSKKSDSNPKKSDSKKKPDPNPKKSDSKKKTDSKKKSVPKSALRTAPSAKPVKKPKSDSPTGVVTAKKPPVAKTVDTSASTPNESWTVVQLRSRARETGLVGYSRLTKAALLAALGSK